MHCGQCFVGMTLVRLHWMGLCMFGSVACNGFHQNSSLGCFCTTTFRNLCVHGRGSILTLLERHSRTTPLHPCKRWPVLLLGAFLLWVAPSAVRVGVWAALSFKCCPRPLERPSVWPVLPSMGRHFLCLAVQERVLSAMGTMARSQHATTFSAHQIPAVRWAPAPKNFLGRLVVLLGPRALPWCWNSPRWMFHPRMALPVPPPETASRL